MRLCHKTRKQQDIIYAQSFLKIKITNETEKKSNNTNLEITKIPIKPLRPISSIKGSYKNLNTSPEYTEYENHYLEIICTDTVISNNPVGNLKRRYPYIMNFRHDVNMNDIKKNNKVLQQTIINDSQSENKLSMKETFIAFLQDIFPNEDNIQESWNKEISIFEETVEELEKDLREEK